MARRRREKQEWVPWYRRKDYKGNLTEDLKRELDAFRMQEKHPATHYEDLPEEVQGYINSLEREIYDFKQGKGAAKALLAGAVGALLIFLSYKGIGNAGDLGYVIGGLLLIVPLFLYRREWRKNADEFVPDTEDGQNLYTDEGIRHQWEVDYFIRRTRGSSD